MGRSRTSRLVGKIMDGRKWYEWDLPKPVGPRATVALGIHPREWGLGFRLRVYRSVIGKKRWFFEFGFEFLVISFSIDTW